jgi:hypothetical protein
VEVVRQEARAVALLFNAADYETIHVFLLPTRPARETDLGGLVDTQWHLAGQTIGGAAICWHLPEKIADPLLAKGSAVFREDVVRHELTHLFLKRAYPSVPGWLNEGLAHEVESMRLTASGEVQARPVPDKLILTAKQPHGHHPLRVLLDSGDQGDYESRHRLRALWRSFVRYLLIHNQDKSFFETVATIAAMRRDELLRLESPWHAWLDSLDVLAIIRQGLESNDLNLRREAAGHLCTLAESDGFEMYTQPACALALDLLRDTDPGVADAAARFLIFFDSGELSADVVGSLSSSSVPMEFLTAQALRKARGEEFDQAGVERMLISLRSEERAESWTAVQFLLPARRDRLAR